MHPAEAQPPPETPLAQQDDAYPAVAGLEEAQSEQPQGEAQVVELDMEQVW